MDQNSRDEIRIFLEGGGVVFPFAIFFFYFENKTNFNTLDNSKIENR